MNHVYAAVRRSSSYHRHRRWSWSSTPQWIAPVVSRSLGRMSVPQSWLDEMNTKQIVYKCHPCVLAEKNLLAGRQFEASNKSSIYDSYGRVKFDGER